MRTANVRLLERVIAEFRRWECEPRLLAVKTENGFIMKMVAVRGDGHQIASSERLIVGYTGATKLIARISTVFSFAKKYGIDTDQVVITGQ